MRGGTARTHHRDTLSSRNNLAGAYQSAGDLGRAIPLYEQTLADRQHRVLTSRHPIPALEQLVMASKPLRDRVTSSLPAQGVLQLHFLDHQTNYTCGRCQWHGQARTIATMNDNWRAPSAAAATPD